MVAKKQFCLPSVDRQAIIAAILDRFVPAPPKRLSRMASTRT
jgi:hypothetical protein